MDIATGAAVSGIRAGIARMDAAAHSIANVNTKDADGQPVEGRRVALREGDPGVRTTEQGTGEANELVGPMVDSMIAKQEVAANASVVRTAHETYRSVLDMV
ncbi:MAG: hypothetical protein AAGA99_04800 [Actinomycetota bacterium]